MLHPGPIAKLRAGPKTIEMRLWDEKRRLMRVGDTILFTSRADSADQLLKRIAALHLFATFDDMLAAFPADLLGYENESLTRLNQGDNGMRDYYSAEDEATYGVVGIEVCAI